eukprot:12654443-Alexandrium_andersonii.AAC.1
MATTRGSKNTDCATRSQRTPPPGDFDGSLADAVPNVAFRTFPQAALGKSCSMKCASAAMSLQKQIAARDANRWRAQSTRAQVCFGTRQHGPSWGISMSRGSKVEGPQGPSDLEDLHPSNRTAKRRPLRLIPPASHALFCGGL